ncbi:MAG: hypothetical protein H7061_08135 [Bdellovibrionaceae bacterium]|nr:hypothetical protein [Bdellovibrio sp.]
MNSKIFLIILSLFWFGCATTPPELPVVQTVRSDMYPDLISRAEYYEQIGISYAQDAQNEKAIENFRLSILHNPKRASVRIQLAEAYQKENLEHLASYELGEALKLEPKNKIAMYQMGSLYLASNIYSKARDSYSNLLNQDQQDENATWALFYTFKIEKKWDQALNVLGRFSYTYPRMDEVVLQRALIYKSRGQNDLYEKILFEAYQINPREKRIAMQYVENLFQRKQIAEAIVVLEQFTQAHDFDLEVSQTYSYAAVQTESYEMALRELDKQRLWTNDLYAVDLKRAHVYFLMGNLNKAEKLYLSLLQKRESGEPRMYLANVYQAKNRPEEANVVLSKISIESDYFGEAQTRMAIEEKRQGYPDEAINRLRKAQILRPDQLIIYKTYADYMIETQHYVETVALLEKAISLFPNDDELRLKMAFVHYRLNNQKAFRKQIAKALKINPNSALIYAVLTELWYLKNKDSKEIEYFARKAIELKSQNKNIQPLLAWALMDQNRSAEAVALFEQFYEENPKEHFYVNSLAQVYSWGNVSTKAQEFSRVATSLENTSSLKSRLVFKLQTKSIDSEPLNSSPARLPASLENR